MNEHPYFQSELYETKRDNYSYFRQFLLLFSCESGRRGKNVLQNFTRPKSKGSPDNSNGPSFRLADASQI